VLPISARDAQPLLAALGGPIAPEGWRGALPLPYRLGPGPAKVRLQLAFDWTVAPLYNVVARLRGRELPDQWILRGNHHDAWVNGATDPVSGMAALLAEARAVGELARTGWRPRRTLVYAGWDGEEQGLLGSTEWAEHHADELRRKLVAYLNTDSNGRGILDAGGSPTLQPLVSEVAAEVRDPRTGASVLERSRAVLTVHGDDDDRKRVKATEGMPVYPLGSGSDYTPFLQHLGVAALNLGFGGEDHYGQYHSVYDSWDHYRQFMDPGFAHGVALAQVMGRITLRLADADVLPFDPAPLAAELAGWRTEVKELAERMRETTAEENRRVREGIYAAAADPAERWVVPPAREPVPFLEFAPLDNAVAAVEEAAQRHAAARAARLARGPLPAAVAARHDAAVMAFEPSLTRAEGLPGRPWYVHQAYSPGFYTGYGVKTLPIVREAIEQRQWGEVDARIAALAETLRGVAAAIDRATAVLEED
jgi:N-acetylated-alpha-linked acidic dipeptidase